MRRVRLLLLGAGLAVASIGRAQTPVAASAPAPLTAPAAGFRAEYVAEVDTVGTKLVQLAEAMPADKYGWRPGPGVRSVGEVYMHVVAGSSMLPTFLGASPMEGITRESEKTVTDKAKIVAYLKESIGNVRAIALKISDADLEKKVKIFGGQEVTERQVLVRILNHMHEHLGQSIAYARMNGVAPPWSKSD